MSNVSPPGFASTLLPTILPAIPFPSDRLAWTLRNLNNAKTNVSPSRAGIRDADLSKETAAYVTNWLSANWAILVLVDRDEGDCLALERDLEKMVADAGLVSMTAGGNADHFQVANQIVVEELEVWFFGDWRAVPIAYPLVLATIPQKVGFRDPDAISGGKWEALERVLKKAGYFKTGLRKMECARAVSRHMEPARKTSNSFQALHGAVSAFLKMT